MKKKIIVLPHPSDAERKFQEFLNTLNYSELLEATKRKTGLPLDSTVPRVILEKLMLGHEITEDFTSSELNKMRQELMDFLNARPDIRAGAECPRDCWSHHDLFVLFCYKQLKNLIKAWQYEKNVKNKL